MYFISDPAYIEHSIFSSIQQKENEMARVKFKTLHQPDMERCSTQHLICSSAGPGPAVTAASWKWEDFEAGLGLGEED